jgi:hypothetical protein
MTDILIILGLLIAGFTTDVVWAVYVRSINTMTDQKSRIKAANFAVGTGICSLIFIEGIFHNVFFAIAWFIGLWLGTYHANSIENLFKK